MFYKNHSYRQSHRPVVPFAALLTPLALIAVVPPRTLRSRVSDRSRWPGWARRTVHDFPVRLVGHSFVVLAPSHFPKLLGRNWGRNGYFHALREWSANTHGISSISFVSLDARIAGRSGKPWRTHEPGRSDVTRVALLSGRTLITWKPRWTFNTCRNRNLSMLRSVVSWRSTNLALRAFRPTLVVRAIRERQLRRNLPSGRVTRRGPEAPADRVALEDPGIAPTWPRRSRRPCRDPAESDGRIMDWKNCGILPCKSSHRVCLVGEVYFVVRYVRIVRGCACFFVT